MSNTEIWRDLICGSAELWKDDPSKIHYQKYLRWIGSHRKVGIELETVQTIKSEQWKKLREYSSWSGYSIESSHESELRVLWKLEDPVKWVSDMRGFVDTVRKAGISTLGSIHLNIQVKDREKKCGLLCSRNMIGAEYRREIKYGPCFFTKQEFVSNMLVGIAYFPDHLERAQKLARILDPIVPDICVNKPSTYLQGMVSWCDSIGRSS